MCVFWNLSTGEIIKLLFLIEKIMFFFLLKVGLVFIFSFSRASCGGVKRLYIACIVIYQDIYALELK